MSLELFLFYIFILGAILSALMVINLANAIHAVFFLILTFCNITLLLLLLGSEFFSFLLLIVYVGAIAVLFLFVIMMLNIKIIKPASKILFLTPLGLVLMLLLGDKFYEFTINFDLLKLFHNQIYSICWLEETKNITNVKVIGYILYTDYCLLFIISSLILLVAMIGVIVLTMHKKPNTRKQQIEFQLLKNPKTTLKFVKIRT